MKITIYSKFTWGSGIEQDKFRVYIFSWSKHIAAEGGIFVLNLLGLSKVSTVDIRQGQYVIYQE